MLSFGGCLQEPKPILRHVSDECLNVRINENWENLEPYHMKNNAAENNYYIKGFVTAKNLFFVFELCQLTGVSILL